MTKYELASKLFRDCSISTSNDFIRVILTMESGGFLSKAFTTDNSLRWCLDKMAFITFLQDTRRLVIKAMATRQLSTWEFGFEFDQLTEGNAALLSAKREFSLDINPPDGWGGKNHALDFNQNDDGSFWDECRRIADLIEESRPERNKINLTGFQTWNRLVPFMDKVVSSINVGIWEKAPPDHSYETAYYAWELELKANQKQTLSITGEPLSALIEAITIADSTSLEFGSASVGSDLTVLIGVDDTFST